MYGRSRWQGCGYFGGEAVRIVSALLYLTLVCLVYFLANYPNFSSRWTAVSYPREIGFLLGTLYGVARIGIVTAWFSVFPAWWMASRSMNVGARALIYIAGLMIFFLPFYTNSLHDPETYAPWHNAAIALGCIGAIALAMICSPQDVRAKEGSEP